MSEHTADEAAKAAIAYHDVLEELSEQTGFSVRAFVFVHEALRRAVELRGESGHVGAAEIADGARVHALEQYGPLAGEVLRYWGVRSTGDLGRAVRGLVECGLIVQGDDDRFEDFDDLYDFETVFEHDYQIISRTRPGHSRN